MIIVVAGAALLLSREAPGIRVGTAVVSRTLCEAVFVSHVDPATLYAEAIKPNPGQTRLAKRLKYEIDRQARQVTVTWAGGFKGRSMYRDALGCMVIPESSPANLPSLDSSESAAGAASARAGAGQFEVEPSSPPLETALDRAFAEPATPPFRRVKAIVIVHRGKIMAERYAPGYSAQTPILGYSLAKSLTNALVGILVRQGKLSVDQRAPVAAWSDPADPRNAITIDQLLRMTSGLSLEESDSGFDPVSRMLFLEPDMAGFAEKARLKAAPGKTWEYTSGNTLILSQIVRDATGGNAQGVYEFAQHELFAPLGITTTTIEFDPSGTPVGSTYALASARDWARLGELYLHDGVADGKRILPEGWVQYSASPTLDTDYGAGFWTNRGGHGDAADRIQAGMPADAFYGSGNLGQRLVVIPSQDLVIVRLGLSYGPGFDIRGLLRLINDTTSALQSQP